MAGGKWETQNKVRPGAYINFETNDLNTMGVDSAGAVAFPVVLDWGVTQKFIKVTSNTKFIETFGKSLGEILEIREAFKANGNVHVYNLASEGTKASGTVADSTLKATAIHGGAGGNKIQVTGVINLDGSTTVKTFFNGDQMDNQTATITAELKPNAFVSFEGDLPSGDFVLTLAGGSTGSVSNGAISNFAEALDTLNFKVVAFGMDDNTSKSLLALKVKEFRENVGKNVAFVTNNYNAADYEGVISVKNGVVLDGGEELTAAQTVYWYGARYAAATTESLTYQMYPGAIDCERLTHDEIVQALKDGHIVFAVNNEEVVVEQDINTFRTFTPAKNQDFRKGKIVRGMDIISNNTQYVFSKYFIGRVNNHADGRDLFKKELMKTVLDPYVRLGVIDAYEPADITIEQGNEKDSVFVVMGLKFVDAMEKLYMRVDCK